MPRIYSVLLSIIVLCPWLGCTVEGFENTDVEFFITKEWKIKEIVTNGSIDANGDLSIYRLKLNNDFTYTRICIEDLSCSTKGTWTLEGNQKQLVLTSEDLMVIESYFILKLKVRVLQLELVSDIIENKLIDNCNGCITYVLEPVKK